MKVKNDHRSKCSNLSNCKEEAWKKKKKEKKSGLQRDSNPVETPIFFIFPFILFYFHFLFILLIKLFFFSGFFFPIAWIGKFTAIIIFHFRK